MNIDPAKKSRAVLKSFFVKNAIPTQQQFEQLIDSMVNQRDDVLVKPGTDPLAIEATGDETSFKKVLNLYARSADVDPTWTLSLRPRSNPADPQTGHPGLSINDAAGNSRLVVDAANGRIGIGVVAPNDALEVAGRIRSGPLTVGPWPAGNGFVFFGASTLDQGQTSNYALLQETGGSSAGRTYLNSPKEIRLRISNSDHMIMTNNGFVGIGTTTPSVPLEVAGNVEIGSLGLGPWPANAAQYVYVGATNLNQAAAGNYALLQGAAADTGTTYLNSPTQVHLRINNGDRAIFDASSFTIFGDLVVTGRIGSGGRSATPHINGWGGGLHTWDVEAEGTIWSRNTVLTGPRDLAEIYFSHDALVPGDVVSLDPEADVITPTSEANCARVIGVVSTEPGFLLNSLMNRDDLPTDGSAGFPVALSGRVPCKVTDEGGPIRRGDLLTAASRPGYAMRAAPIGAEGVYRAGSIIGKALGSLAAGEGMIEVFVMLH